MIKTPYLRMGLSLAVAGLSMLILASALAAAQFPLKVSANGRHLVDQNGVPFLMSGDSPQAMVGNLSVADAELFFANRRSHGFNSVWINLLCSTYIGCHDDASTFDGIPPFNVPYDFSTPNEAYFARAEAILRLAANYGFLVILNPAETGDWLSYLYLNGEDKCRAYGQYLGQRYAAFDNIIWMHGNDYQAWGPDPDRFVTAVARGIRDTAGHHLQTVELNFFVSSSTDDPLWRSLIDLNAAYTYEPVYQEVLKDYNRADVLPVFLVEAAYEGENGTPQRLRAQAYWALLSGATGHLYGNRYMWQFLDGWKNELDSSGAIQMGHVAALFESRPWWDLVPDQDHATVVSGRGQFGEIDYATAARTPDGRLVMAYIPYARTVTVDMSRLSGPAVARWYDPSRGTFSPISGSALPNSGLVSFTTPGDNADGPGNEDWVLVIETTSVSQPSLIELSVASEYRPGDQIYVLLRAFNAPEQVSRDLFTGVIAPDGHTIVYFTAPNVIGGTATSESPASLRPIARVTPGEFRSFWEGNPVLAATIPEGTPPGVYTWFAALTVPGALAGTSRLDLGNLETVALRSITLLP